MKYLTLILLLFSTNLFSDEGIKKCSEYSENIKTLISPYYSYYKSSDDYRPYCKDKTREKIWALREKIVACVDRYFPEKNADPNLRFYQMRLTDIKADLDFIDSWCKDPKDRPYAKESDYHAVISFVDLFTHSIALTSAFTLKAQLVSAQEENNGLREELNKYKSNHSSVDSESGIKQTVKINAHMEKTPPMDITTTPMQKTPGVK